jgi:hypothetical protein
MIIFAALPWNKNRGTNPPGSPFGPECLNDLHFTRAEEVHQG